MKRLLAVFAFLLFSISAQAETLLQFAADGHLGRQGDYYDDITHVTEHGVWEWQDGSSHTDLNILGVCALGMVYAYDTTHKVAYLNAATDTANVLANYYASNPVRPYAQDIVLFSRLCKSSGQSSWCGLATSLYGRVVNDFPAPNDNVDRYINSRASIAGWDVSWHIEAAYLSGYTAYAQAMATRLFSERSLWENSLYDGYNFTHLSWGAIVWAYAPLSNQGGNKDSRKTVMDLLLAAQNADGSWDQDYQATAYAVLGLNTGGGGQRGLNAVNAATAYFAGTVNSQGGWQYPGDYEYGEINSEIVSALSGAPSVAVPASSFTNSRFIPVNHRPQVQSMR